MLRSSLSLIGSSVIVLALSILPVSASIVPANEALTMTEPYKTRLSAAVSADQTKVILTELQTLVERQRAARRFDGSAPNADAFDAWNSLLIDMRYLPAAPYAQTDCQDARASLIHSFSPQHEAPSRVLYTDETIRVAEILAIICKNPALGPPLQ